MGLEKLGVFNTPETVVMGNNIPVYDLRVDNNGVAEWYILRYENLKTCFILTDSKDDAIGQFVTEGKYLKWNLSINLYEDIVLASLWRGDDCSRSGAHGTQMYAYLATDLKGQEQFRLSSRVKTDLYNFDTFNLEDSKASFPQSREYDIDVEWNGMRIQYRQSYSVECGRSRDHMRATHRTVPSEAYLRIGEEERYELGEELKYSVVARKIREHFGKNIPPEIEEVLLVEDFIREETQVKNLFEFLLRRGDIFESELTRKYFSSKQEEIEAEKDGVMFDFIGHFRRMGASKNCDLWVIGSDGSLREPDELERRKDYPEGNKRWRRVETDELALAWHCGLNSRAWEGSEYEVVHAPKNITERQKQTVRKIEEEIKKVTGEGPGKFFAKKQKKIGTHASREEISVYSDDGDFGNNPFAVALAGIGKK